MKIRRPVINIDLDNVVADFSHSIRAMGEKALGRELSVSSRWDMWEDWGITQGAWKRMFRDGVRNGVIWSQDPPIEGAVEGLWDLSDSEYYIRIVTHRLVHFSDYDLTVKVTSDWLNKHHIPYRSLAVIGDEPKSNYRAEALLDDGPHNISDWVGAGHNNAIVFDAVWNQDVPTLDTTLSSPSHTHHRLPYRAMDWKDAVNLIKTLVPNE